MRIERLNSDKVKVTLTTADLINLDIDMEQLTPDSRELHTFLFRIMETIREETGFNPYNGQVMVEASPSRDGMSIVISRLATPAKRVTKRQFYTASGVKVATKQAEKTSIFYFDNFSDLCGALVRIEGASLVCATLYRLNSTYCFTIPNKPCHKQCIHIMLEFSAKQSAHPMQMTYIKEHGTLVAKGTKLFEMTEKIKQLT